MIIVAQRVSEARVRVEEGPGAGHDESIGRGLVLLVAVEHADTEADLDWGADKCANLRIFPDDAGKMNRSLLDLPADDRGVMVISQFTLAGDAQKGNRPSFVDAAPPDKAAPLVERLASRLESHHGLRVARGVFAAHMLVSLTNDGPVTITLNRGG